MTVSRVEEGGGSEGEVGRLVTERGVVCSVWKQHPPYQLLKKCTLCVTTVGRLTSHWVSILGIAFRVSCFFEFSGLCSFFVVVSTYIYGVSCGRFWGEMDIRKGDVISVTFVSRRVRHWGKSFRCGQKCVNVGFRENL